MDEEAKIAVKIVEQHGKSVLVQWKEDAGLRRVYVPVKKIVDDTCDAETLERGIPHGIRWEELIDVGDITPEAIARELRQHGLWTLADLRQYDRHLIRIGTNLVGRAVWNAAQAHEAQGGK